MKDPIYKGYIWAVFISLDQLGNALAGGHPDMTVSARLGYLKHTRSGRWWGPARKMVNWAFYPVDGLGHCGTSFRTACAADEQAKLRRGNDVGLCLLMVLVVFLVLPLRLVNTIRRWFR